MDEQSIMHILSFTVTLGNTEVRKMMIASLIILHPA